MLEQTITHQSGVIDKIDFLIDKKNTLKIGAKEHNAYFISALLLRDKDFFYADLPTDSITLKQILRSNAIEVVFIGQNETIQFTVKSASQVEVKGHTYLRMAFPGEMHVLQRREWRRVIIPRLFPVTFDSEINEGREPLHAVDISLSGMAFVNFEDTLRLEKESLISGILTIDKTLLNITVKVVNYTEIHISPTKNATRIGVEFKSLNCNDERHIQMLINKIDMHMHRIKKS